MSDFISLKPESLIVIEDPKNPARNGAWKIESATDKEQGGCRLLLESVYRGHPAFLSIDFDKKIMRQLDPVKDLAYKDAFMPIGTEIEVTGTKNTLQEGSWIVDHIIEGDDIKNARLGLKKISKAFNDRSPPITWATPFNAETMTVTKTVEPKLLQFKPTS
jgi:hypothetical protein